MACAYDMSWPPVLYRVCGMRLLDGVVGCVQAGCACGGSGVRGVLGVQPQVSREHSFLSRFGLTIYDQGHPRFRTGADATRVRPRG